MPTFQMIRGIRYGGEEVNDIESVADDTVVALDITVDAEAADEEHEFPINIENLKALYIRADKAGSLKINNANGTEVTLTPTLAHLWTVAGGGDCPLGALDVTQILVTNDSTTDSMRLRAYALLASEPPA